MKSSNLEPVLVMKFGGTSVADAERVRRAAALAALRRRQGNRVVVVVSARSGLTDRLIEEARQVTSRPEPREMDMLLSAGERLSAALFSIMLNHLGIPAVSLTGSQAGIITDDQHTNARIIEVRPYRVRLALEGGHVVVVGGFQGVSFRKDVTTLGRGGSDTSAVALAAALDAVRCEIYSDVDGIYSGDPRLVDQPKRLDQISYQEMQEMAESGAKVLHPQSVEFAKLKGTILCARSTEDAEAPGTLIRNLEGRLRPRVVGVASEEKVVLLAGRADPATCQLPKELLELCRRLRLRTKQLSFHLQDQREGILSLIVPEKENYHLTAALQELGESLAGHLRIVPDCAAVSMIGSGITEHYDILLEAASLLEREGIAPLACHTSSFRISWIVPRRQMAGAVRALHGGFID